MHHKEVKRKLVQLGAFSQIKDFSNINAIYLSIYLTHGRKNPRVQPSFYQKQNKENNMKSLKTTVRELFDFMSCVS